MQFLCKFFHILCKYNKEKIKTIYHRSAEILRFLRTPKIMVICNYQGHNQKIDRGNHYSFWGRLQLVNVWPFTNGVAFNSGSET